MFFYISDSAYRQTKNLSNARLKLFMKKFMPYKKLTRLIILSMLVSSVHLFSYTALASAFESSVSVYRFQQKLANKGNPDAQYKLGMMYETGNGVEINPVKARTWYNKSAYQNFKPAKNRLIYLDIKQNGLKENHNFWIKSLRHDAVYGDGEALFLLGQMYSKGIGVNRDLEKALRILQKAAASNIPGSELELAQTERTYEQEKKKQTRLRNKQRQEQKILASVKEKNRLEKQQLIAEQKRRAIEQKIINQQRLKFAETYKLIEQKQSTEKKQRTTSPVPVDEKTISTDNIETNICSGKNRFIASCR